MGLEPGSWHPAEELKAAAVTWAPVLRDTSPGWCEGVQCPDAHRRELFSWLWSLALGL